MTSNSNALSLIGDAYNSEEEESSESTPEISPKPQKLPVPESLKNLFCDSSGEEILDMPELHGGRIRSFPHERGNWATSIFIPYKRSSLLSQVCDSFIKTCDRISKFSECDDFHLSLSRTVIIRHHWIEPLVRDVESKMKSLERFPIDFNDVGIYVNDEKTRTFIALKVGVGYHQLMNCVTAIDQCLSEFRLPTYYEDPSFHLSLIWCVGDRKEELTNLIPVLKSQYLSLIEDNLQSQFVYVTRMNAVIIPLTNPHQNKHFIDSLAVCMEIIGGYSRQYIVAYFTVKETIDVSDVPMDLRQQANI